MPPAFPAPLAFSRNGSRFAIAIKPENLVNARSRCVLAATLLATLGSTLFAQTNLSVAAGAALPIGGTADHYKLGYNATLALGLNPPLAPIGFRIEGMLNVFDGKTIDAGNMQVLGGSANITLSSAALPIPMGYLIGGVGAYNVKFTDRLTGLGGSTSSTQPALNIGAGIRFPLTGFSSYLEARLHLLTTSKEKFLPITFGLTF